MWGYFFVLFEKNIGREYNVDINEKSKYKNKHYR